LADYRLNSRNRIEELYFKVLGSHEGKQARKRCKIETWLLQITNSKVIYTPSIDAGVMTLSDLQSHSAIATFL